MRRRFSGWVAVLLVLAGGCSSVPSPLPAASTPDSLGQDPEGGPRAVSQTPDCGRLVLSPTETDPLKVVLDTGAAAKERDARCGPPADAVRVCRALWLAQELDPLVVAGRDASPDVAQQAANLLAWYLADGAAAAPTAELAAAFDQLRAASELISGLAGNNRPSPATDAALAAAITNRAAAVIVGPLAAAEHDCS